MDEIRIIQGDTYEAKLRWTGIDDVSIIEKVVFSCKDLGICKEVRYHEEEGAYLLKFTHEETIAMQPCDTDFDITITYTDKTVQTPIYRKRIIIQRKVNLCG